MSLLCVLALLAAALAVLYRVAPERDAPKIKWVSVGAVFATVLWLLASAGFSLYVEDRADRGDGELAGAIGALLCEIGFPVAAMRGVAVISRSAGLLAHAIEELETETTPAVLSLVTEAIPYESES